jgi:2-oxo-4-hydroxy-4-carboxy-5-ureidoimidazoline decarboxylase
VCGIVTTKMFDVYGAAGGRARAPYDQPVITDPGLARFNRLVAVRGELRACCASTEWVELVALGRPYPDRAALLTRSDAVLAELNWAGVREALDAHPRIGERAPTADKTSREAAWSGREQSGMDTATERTRADLVAANRAYEERFGHVFLIFATGRTDREMLAAATARVGHDEQTEHAVVRLELGRIVALRLAKLLDALATEGS